MTCGLRRESYCKVEMHGHFLESLVDTVPHISFNVTTQYEDGREGLLPGEDDFCNWLEIEQDDETALAVDTSKIRVILGPEQHDSRQASNRRSASGPLNGNVRAKKNACPPEAGPAKLTYGILLLGGWVPEANYTVKVRTTAEGSDGREGRTIFDLRTDFEMTYGDDYFSLPEGADDGIFGGESDL